MYMQDDDIECSKQSVGLAEAYVLETATEGNDEKLPIIAKSS